MIGCKDLKNTKINYSVLRESFRGPESIPTQTQKYYFCIEI